MHAEDLSGVGDAGDEGERWDTVERLLPGALFDRRYRVTVPVGRDERSLRFAGLDTVDNQPVAIEVTMLADVGGRSGASELVRAVFGVRELRHPDVVPTLAAGLLDALWAPTSDLASAQAVWSVSALRAGGTLRQLLDRGRRLSPAQAVVVGFHVARALAVLHAQDRVHGQVTPAHIRFGADGRVGLTGVPLAHLQAMRAWQNTDDVDVERAWYAAPELATGGQPSPEADVYSLCLTLVEAVTGEVPFAHNSTVASLGARVGRLLPVSADLGPLAAVLERAGRPDPDDRCTAAQLVESLVRCAESLPRPDPLPIVTDDSAGLERPDLGSRVSRAVAAPSPSPAPPAPTPREAAPPSVATVAPTPPQPARDEGRTPPRRWSPRRITTVVVGAVVIAALVGFLAMRLFSTPSYAVPDLVGRPGPEVANAVVDFNWTLDVRRERSDDVGVDEVIRTEPAAGIDLERGGTLVVVLSDGPTFVELPDVVGLDAQAALAALRERGLVATVTAARPDEEAPVDQVLRWFVVDQPTLTTGAEVVKGTEVALEVSQGPAPREVPDVVGSESDRAVATLEALGLVAERAEDFSDTIPAGQVAAQRPLPGEVVPRDSSVLIVVSKGPDVVVVPDLDRLDHAERLEALVEADLVVGNVTGDTSRRLLGLAVDGTPVRSGDAVRRGSTVSLVYELAP